MPELRFGLDLPAGQRAAYDPVAEARRAESLGYDFVSTSDHPEGTQPSYETWTMLTWIAAHTSRIRIATRVLGVPYRPPAMVAKMAETLDRLSAGRLILGLGGGYADEEFRAFGLPVPSPREKVDGMVDAIRIARGLWSQPSLTYEGSVYHTRAANVTPKPDRHIPIWLGTYGPRALTATGQLADGWIPSLGLVRPERVPAMRHRILAAAEAAGRSPDSITCVYNLGVRIDPSAKPSPSTVTGSTEAIAEQLLSFTRLGFTVFNVQVEGDDRTEQVERFATEVMPALRG